MAFFWGLTIGALHWWLFTLSIQRLVAGESSSDKLWQVAWRISFVRHGVTLALLALLRACGVATTPMIGGLLASSLFFRVLASRQR